MAKFANLAVFVLFIYVAEGIRNKPPLLGEDGGRIRNKAAECTFGSTVKELGSQWVPDLGVPFGVLYCMKCECAAFQKKRRIVAKVQCRNIKNECPEPTCAEPILPKGRCCKVCPGDSHNPDVIQDVVPQNVLDEDEKGSKHFVALLTGKSSLVIKNDYTKLMPNEVNKKQIVATGRFSFHKRNLHYSFYISEKAARPRALYFMDQEGTILEEFTLSKPGGHVTSVYQNTTRKVCGVWKRLPKQYRRYLKQEKLFVSLIWGIKDHTEFSISGQLIRNAALSKETFSSLLEPAPESNSFLMNGSGGTAIVSISTALSPSIHIAVIFNGIFSNNEISEIPVNITLSLDDKRFILKENVYVKKPSNELNVVEISSPVSNADLRLLTRGKLLLSISSVSQPTARKLSGNVMTKATCEIFQSLLLSNSEQQNPYRTSGLAWLFLNNEGSLVYNIQVANWREVPESISLIDTSTKRKPQLEDLTPYFENGWANGTIDKLSPKVLEPLYAGNLALNLATTKTPSLLKGKLVSKTVADARDSPAPLLLRRQNYTLPSSAVGLAWINIDDDCHIQYDITVAGLGNEKKLDVFLELLPMLAPGAPVITRHLDSFQGNQVEGSPVESLVREELNRLDTGVGFLKIKEGRETLFSATIKQIEVPPSCRPPYTDNNVPTLLYDNGDDPPSGDCFHEGKFYQEEAQWTSTSDPCTMCFCQNGKEKCDTMICPEPGCPEHMRVKEEGECCPTCPTMLNITKNELQKSNLLNKCLFNGKSYSRGSKFYPFLIPNGFDLCTECFCDPIYLEIKCVRLTNEKNCCRNCQKGEFNMENYPADELPARRPTIAHKKEVSKSVDQILSEGGCRNLMNPQSPYENGSEYHPFLDSLGEYKCVNCKCTNGIQQCKRHQCDKAACEKMFKMRRNKTLTPSENCCSVKDCRKYRHRKSHRLLNHAS